MVLLSGVSLGRGIPTSRDAPTSLPSPPDLGDAAISDIAVIFPLEYASDKGYNRIGEPVINSDPSG